MMAEGTTVGLAYLNVVPRMDGASAFAAQAAGMGTSMGSQMAGGMSSSFSAGTVALGGIISSLGMQAAGAIGSFFKDSLSAGMDFDSAMSQVAATMGVTKDEVADLRDYAKEMGSTTRYSATEAAEALNYMALAGYDSEKSMSMLPNVLNLAAAGNMELARASDMVTDAASALGLSTEETTVLVDQMAQAASKSNTSVEQLGDAMLTVGGTAKVVKGGTQEVATALGILADNGIKGSEGGTALRNVILSLTAPTDQAAMAMEDLGLQVFDAEGNMRPMNEVLDDMGALLGDMTEQQRAEWISTVFNKRDLKSVEALLANTGANVSNISEKLASSGVDWEKYAGTVLATGDTLSGTADDIASRVNSAFTAMSGAGKSYDEILSAVQERFGLTREDAVVALDAIQEETANGTNRWQELSAEIGNAAGAAQQMADTQLDNLEGDTIKFQSALEGLQIQLYEGVEPALRTITQAATDAISGMTQWLGEGGLETIMGNLQAAMEPFIPILQDWGEKLQNLGEVLGGAIADGLTWMGDWLSGHSEDVGWIIDKVGEIGGGVIDGIAEGVKLVHAALVAAEPLIRWLADDALSSIKMLLEGISWAIDSLVGNIAIINAAIESARTGSIEPLADALKNRAAKEMEHVGNVGDLMAERIETDAGHMGRAIDAAAGEFEDSGGRIDSTMDDVEDATKRPWSEMSVAARKAAVDTESEFSGMGERISAAITPKDITASVSYDDFWAGDTRISVPSIRWFGSGGWADNATLFGAGERGGEFVWPSYGPYLDKYADALASRMGGGAGVTITGNEFNVRSEADIEAIGRKLSSMWNMERRRAQWAV